MKFEIYKSSDWSPSTKQPHPKAKLITWEEKAAYNVTTVKDFLEDPTKVKMFESPEPKSYKRWEIEVNTLEELLEIIQSTKDKRVVIEKEGDDWMFEIYDTYRE